jgi:hypothetical protein
VSARPAGLQVLGCQPDNKLMSVTRSKAPAVAALLLASLLALAAKEYVAPRAYDARTYPARDEHANEHVTIAADPYDMPDKASIFALNYREHDYLPVYLIVTNNSGQPISLVSMRAQFVTADRTKISPATADDLFRRFSRLKRRGDEPSRNPLPIPLPRRGAQAGVSKEGVLEIQNAPFQAKAVDPHDTQAGFLFFDVRDISQPLAGAHLYITGVKDANGSELMFFDIAMEKYLTYRP